MNQVQLKYARTRAEDIRKEKIKKIRDDNTTKAINLTHEEKLKALKDGEYTIDKNLTKSGYYWYNSIKFNAERPQTIDTETVIKESAKVESAFCSLMDELILGDNEEALKLLSAFEKI